MLRGQNSTDEHYVEALGLVGCKEARQMRYGGPERRIAGRRGKIGPEQGERRLGDGFQINIFRRWVASIVIRRKIRCRNGFQHLDGVLEYTRGDSVTLFSIRRPENRTQYPALDSTELGHRLCRSAMLAVSWLCPLGYPTSLPKRVCQGGGLEDRP